MGYAEIQYETRQAAESMVLHWDKGQLDGEVVEASFIPRITRPPRPSERPVRARVPLSPPRRGPRRQGRRRNDYSPPPPTRRNYNMNNYSPPRRARGANAGPIGGPRGPTRGRSPPPPIRGRRRSYSRSLSRSPVRARMDQGAAAAVELRVVGEDEAEVTVPAEADHLVEISVEEGAGVEVADGRPPREEHVVHGHAV
ncbi:hypothetical protein BGX34_000011 [Mortierella sp. NVP85]|nr:hypothetical protein BGX34_000011 [Mortierella sp. NVP85]